MSLLDEAKALEKRQGGTCSVADVLDSEMEEALDAIRAGKLQGTALEKALAKRGVTVKAANLRRHARGDCSCKTDVAA